MNQDKCSIGHPLGQAGGAWICGPKHNTSRGQQPVLPPSPPVPPCPVPFGLTGGKVVRHIVERHMMLLIAAPLRFSSK